MMTSLLQALWEEGDRLSVLLLFNVLVTLTGDDVALLMFVLLVSILQQESAAKEVDLFEG